MRKWVWGAEVTITTRETRVSQICIFKVPLWSNFYLLIFRFIACNPMKEWKTIYRLQKLALVREIFKFEKWVKYAKEMTYDIKHLTQCYIMCIKTQLANLQRRSYRKHTYGYETFCCHCNSLFSSPDPLDFKI